MVGTGIICFVTIKIRVIPLMFDSIAKGQIVSRDIRGQYSFIIPGTIRRLILSFEHT